MCGKKYTINAIISTQTFFLMTFVIVAFFGKRNYRVLIRVCVFFLHDNSKRNRSRNTKLEYIVIYENSSDLFDIELRPIKVKVTVGVKTFSPFTHLLQYKLSGPIV